MKHPKIVKFYVYIITNQVLNKQYVGSKMCYSDDPNNDGYMGSSKYLKEDIKQYGNDNFTKEILTYCDDKIDMLNTETENIYLFNTLTPNGYNRFIPNSNTGFHLGGCFHSDLTKEKMSQNNANKGKPLSDAAKKHLHDLYYGKTNSEIYGKEKADIMRANQKLSVEQRKEAGTYICPTKGMIQSKESNEKRSIRLKGRIPWNAGLTGCVSQATKEIKTCEHCGKICNKINYFRWHGVNCRSLVKI